MTTAIELKKEILLKTKQYYEIVHKPSNEKEFIPGKSNIHYASRVFDEDEISNLIDCSLDFWLTHGKYSKKFEKDFASYLNIKWTLLVNSGSSANLLAFMALTSPLLKERQVLRGDEVITVATCFPTTISPIIQYGALPVFVDIEPKTLNIDVDLLKAALSSKTKAVMIAHTLGNPFNIEAVKEFCDENNLWLIEDNCDALGSKYKDKYTGTYGDIGTSSFYPPHHMTMGEGGAVYTNNPLLKKIMLSMRDWGRDCWCDSGVDNTCKMRFKQEFSSLPFGYDHKYVYSHFGYNLKATDMQAAIGIAQLKKLPQFINSRKKNFNILNENLKNLKNFTIIQKQNYSDPSWFGFLLVLQDTMNNKRNQLSLFLEKNKIQTRNLFAGNITKHPLFNSLQRGIDYKVSGQLNNTDDIMQNALWVGVYPGMSYDHLEYISKTIRLFFKR